jgi:protein-tyrosine phosphatase
MSVPDKPDEFKKLVAWTRKQLEAGLKVHCGCMGGHGRTGTFLAALSSDFGEKDAISHVRRGIG